MPKSSKQPVDESSKALLSAIYSFLKESKFSSTAKSLLKEASLDASTSSDEKLSEIFSSYLVAKKKSVIKEETSDSSSSSSDSSSSEDSDSDDKKKKVAATTTATKKAPVAESSDDSSDDESSDDEEVKAPVKTAAKKEESSDDSSSSDSDSDSSEDEKPVAKKATPAAAAAKKAESSDSDSSDSSEDEAPVKAVATKRKAESSSDSSSSSSESEEEEEEEVKKPAAKKVRVEAPAAEAADGEAFVAVVRGLPWSAGEDEVRSTFSGSIVEVELPLDDSGRSSGMAVVTFGSRADLDAALAKDGETFPGSERWMKVTEGRPSRKSVGSAPSSGEKPEGCDTVFVGNLPWDVTEEQMHELFSQCGEVAKVRFATSQEDGSFRGFGHVQFVDGESTDAAVQMYGTDVNGRAIRVDYAPPRNRESLGGGGGGRGGRESFGSPRAGGRDGGRGRGRGGDGGRGGRGGGRGGSSFGTPTAAGKNKGAIAAGSGKKTTFD